jgi:hypothetical protein
VVAEYHYLLELISHFSEEFVLNVQNLQMLLPYAGISHTYDYRKTQRAKFDYWAPLYAGFEVFPFQN